ncbi:hypothetical protein FDP22_20290 (plasmid) [Paroceanicella profunda]|uniref:Uncharacterized protein n=1 Tax=Paroceanicella profunda TaxID=2579971 RepID=A0A5B8G0F3_9RHOB|nr:hypothetical protein [Paroceanicella profunda]QDL94195.1 hypothetical protein FDP22_20290 [Paroceanicella profunda]
MIPGDSPSGPDTAFTSPGGTGARRRGPRHLALAGALALAAALAGAGLPAAAAPAPAESLAPAPAATALPLPAHLAQAAPRATVTGVQQVANVRSSNQPPPRPGSAAPAAPVTRAAAPASPISPKEADEPKPRPGSVTVQAPAPEISSASRYAVGRTTQPLVRPQRIAAKAVRQPATAVPTSAVAVVTTPVNTSTRAAATDSGLFDRSALNLIGIYGTEHSRRALVRLPSGKYVRVTRGDSFEGWQVAAISEDSVHLLRSGQTQVLKIPKK